MADFRFASNYIADYSRVRLLKRRGFVFGECNALVKLSADLPVELSD